MFAIFLFVALAHTVNSAEFSQLKRHLLGGYGSCNSGGRSGTCMPTSSCSGQSVPHLCPGPANVQCCLSSGGGSHGSVNAWIDINYLASTSNLQCMVAGGTTKLIARAWHSYGGMDTNAVTNVERAMQVGLEAEVYMFPCPTKDANSQVDSMANGLSSVRNGINRIWLDIETNPSHHCGWPAHSQSSNCAYVQTLANRVVHHGYKVGLYGGHSSWITIAGSSCHIDVSSQAKVPVWFARYNSHSDCSGYVEFNRDDFPVARQWAGSVQYCGHGVDKSVVCDNSCGNKCPVGTYCFSGRCNSY